LTIAGANIALAGVSAAVISKLRGGSFSRALLSGSLGGALVYAGKWVSAEHFDGAGLLGRELAAVGASVVRNASLDDPILGTVVLPFGPIRIYVVRDWASRRRMRIKADLPALVSTAYAVWHPKLDLDLARSLSAGTPIFVARESLLGSDRSGMYVAGVIWAKETDPNVVVGPTRDLIVAHETVHTIQHDFVFIAWGEPVERWLLGTSPAGEP
jgi:hypothetical protein